MLVQLAVMSALLGISSFLSGLLPLSFTFSKSHLERLSALGNGLLLGAALGVIIPEGVESVVEAETGSEPPTSTIALSLIVGFTFMLIIEQLVSPHSHSTQDLPVYTKHVPEVEFDADLGDMELEQSGAHASRRNRQADATSVLSPSEADASRRRAFTLTLGLIIHGLADGLALGVSSLKKVDPGEVNNLSIVVFLALIIHKAPTSLALTTSLLGTSLPRHDCKKHLAFFSSSTPIGAIGSYFLLSFLGITSGNWTGIALLVSGGTFLYVATVLQPLSHTSGHSSLEMLPASRVTFVSIGMFIPFILSAILGHGH